MSIYTHTHKIRKTWICWILFYRISTWTNKVNPDVVIQKNMVFLIKQFLTNTLKCCCNWVGFRTLKTFLNWLAVMFLTASPILNITFTCYCMSTPHFLPFIEPIYSSMGFFLNLHFYSIFYLFFSIFCSNKAFQRHLELDFMSYQKQIQHSNVCLILLHSTWKVEKISLEG